MTSRRHDKYCLPSDNYTGPLTVKAEAMTCNLEILGLYSPRYHVENLVLPEDTASDSPNYSVDGLQRFQWKASIS